MGINPDIYTACISKEWIIGIGRCSVKCIQYIPFSSFSAISASLLIKRNMAVFLSSLEEKMTIHFHSLSSLVSVKLRYSERERER